MAKRGRKPKPPELRAVAGVVGPSARPAELGFPEKPETIAVDPIASKEWDRIVERLHGRKILSPDDRWIVAALAEAVSRLTRARMLLDEYEISTKDGMGTKANPMVSVAAQASKDIASFASELGMTPTARARTMGAGDGTKDDFEEFINQA